MATIKLILNQSRRLNDGTYTLIWQIIHNRRRGVVFTPYHLLPKDFDAQRGKVIASERTKAARARAKEINEYIDCQTRKLRQTITDLEASGKPFTPRDITATYRCRCDLQYVQTYIEQLCGELEKQKKYSTALNYRSMLSVFVKFSAGKEYRFESFDEQLLEKFENYLREIPLKRNTITFHMRILSAVYNKALKQGLIPRWNDNPFRAVSFRMEKTRKLAVDAGTLRRVADADFSRMPWLEEARDLFIFSFYARGMSFVDMAYLTHDNLRNGTLYYTRHKTSQLFSVRIVEPLQKIIDRYAYAAPWILPVMSSGSPDTPAVERHPLAIDASMLLYRTYKHALTNYWYYLGVISNILKTEKRLTFNVARHSWASLAQDRGIPLAVISGGLGHTSERTTSIYLDKINEKKVDQANEIVIRL